MTLTAGSRLGPYTISAPIGRGGMGEVFRAHDSRLNRDVAIKVLPEAFASDPALGAGADSDAIRDRRVGRLASGLPHRGVGPGRDDSSGGRGHGVQSAELTLIADRCSLFAVRVLA